MHSIWTLHSEESTGSRRRSQWVVVVRISLPPPHPSLFPFKLTSVLVFLIRTGTVFQGVHTIAGKEVAIKLEPAIARSSPLKQESKIYKTLMGGPGVPWIMWSGRKGDYNVMVIDLLGPSLEDFFRMCNRYFSLKTVLLLADQLVSAHGVSLPNVASQASNQRRSSFLILYILDLTHRVHPLPRPHPPRRQTRQFRHGHRQKRRLCQRHRLWLG